MPNNYRILPIGAYYISKVGVDGALPTGLDPNEPKATLTRYGAVNVVGAGVYKGTITLNSATNTASTYIADGTVVINANGGNILASPSTSDTNIVSLNTSTFNAHTIWVRLNTLSYIATRGQNAYNVVYENGLYTHTGTATTQPNQINCTYENITFSATASFLFSYCRLFNSILTVGSATVLNNSYVDSATIINWATFVVDFNAGRFTHNNFRGIININSTLYELKQDKDGNPIDPNPSVLDLGSLVTGLYTTRRCFSQDPEFLNLEKRDYRSVSNTSPMLFSDSTGIGNIARVRYSKVIKATDTEFSMGTISDLVSPPDFDLETSADDFILNPPATEGIVTSLAIELAPIPQAIGRLTPAMLLNFNSSIAKGTIENNNIATVDNYDFLSIDPIEQAGANPRRLTYLMRWSNQLTEPLTDGEWDNQGYLTAGDFVKFEHHTKPLIDVTGKGNGEPDFNDVGSAGLKAKWVQFGVYIRNGLGIL